MKNFFDLSLYCLFLSFIISVLASSTALAAEKTDVASAEESRKTFTFDEIVVTAPPITNPLRVETDPKAPRQPVPPADGGGYLKNIPGFSLTRKGGTSGDPLFRGLGGTRLNILLDGGYLLGGCPNRMDPPTAYVFPESYSKITLLKGPESVLYGGGNIAGTVLFERNTVSFQEPGTRFTNSFLFGSNGRRDQLFDATSGDTTGYVRVIKTKSDSSNYTDGSGKQIHSSYSRDSVTGIVGITPNTNTLLEFSVDSSNGQAAYADRTMDGAKFDRTSYNLKFEKRNVTPIVSAIKFNASRSFIDHVMDNYSLRPLVSNASAASMEVDRTTTTGRLAADFSLSDTSKATVGFDYQKNEHSGNMVMGRKDYGAVPLTPDMTFKNYGVFAEYKNSFDEKNRLLSGMRFDDLSVTYAKYPGRVDKNRTTGAFLRYEHDNERNDTTSYIGIGHAERPADWWERKKTGGMTVTPEKNTQIDTGLLYHSGRVTASLSAFYSNIDDFILITNSGNQVVNVDAKLYGGEAEYSYSLSDQWTVSATLAYTRGLNNTNHRPLPQIAPLEGTLGLKFMTDKWETGVFWRMVAAQKHYSLGDGNEIGNDLGPSGGFGILSINTAYRPNKNWTIAAGIDNLFNKNYAEFVSRNGAAIAGLGITSTVRVNEPGRTFWLKTSYNF